MLGNNGRKRFGLAAAGTAITVAIAVPTWVAASEEATDSWTPATVAQEAEAAELYFDGEFPFWDEAGAFGAEMRLDRFGDDDGHLRPRHFAVFGGFAISQEVMDQFGIEPEELRAAFEAVREQFPADERPEVDRPLSDEDRATLEAYRAEQVAALAAELGIPVEEFQAAIDAAEEERRAAFEERRAAMEERRHAYQAALAEALGVTVEELQAAIEEAREAVGDDHPLGPLGTDVFPATETAPLF